MSSFVSSDGLKLDYAVDNFTDPWKPTENLVLLHSAMGCKDRFFSWMPRLARRFRVARLDLRGHGASEVPPPERELSIDRLMSDVLEFMEEVGVDHAHFVGASAGGYLSQRMAMDHPEKVDSLCLFGSTPGFKGGQAKKWLPQIKEKGLRTFLAETISDRYDLETTDPALVNWFLDQAGGNDEEYIGRFIALMDNQDWSDELGKIRCPTLLIVPGAGKIGDYEGFERMRRSIPDITVKTYENMPHNVWDSLPDRCVSDVIDFIDQASPRSGRNAEVA